MCVARQTVFQGKPGNHASHVVGSRIPDGGDQMWKLEMKKERKKKAGRERQRKGPLLSDTLTAKCKTRVREHQFIVRSLRLLCSFVRSFFQQQFGALGQAANMFAVVSFPDRECMHEHSGCLSGPVTRHFLFPCLADIIRFGVLAYKALKRPKRGLHSSWFLLTFPDTLELVDTQTG